MSSAQAAFGPWAATAPAARADVLLRAAALLRERNDALARTETHDTGKPFSETRTIDVQTAADVLAFYGHLVGGGGGLDGTSMPAPRPGTTLMTTKEPLGVCAAIGAWNYPLQIAAWKAAPALAAGNTVVYKASEVTPLHSTTLAQLLADAGLPPGAFNVVQGAGDVGAALAAHPAVAKVSFTGQVATGQKVAGAAGAALKRTTMELGGKSALVVLGDADAARAADVAMMANFMSSGQVCTNGTRVLVPDALQPAFEAAVLARLEHVRPEGGDVFAPAANFGPLASAAQRDKFERYVRHGRDVDGATLLAGGPEPPAWLADDGVDARLRAGFWVRPTVFTGVTDAMLIARDEIFGPVMSILTYRAGGVDDAVARANASPLGLAGGVVGTDLGAAQAVARRLDSGVVWVNTWGDSPADMPVAPWKMSGLGVENGPRRPRRLGAAAQHLCRDGHHGICLLQTLTAVLLWTLEHSFVSMTAEIRCSWRGQRRYYISTTTVPASSSPKTEREARRIWKTDVFANKSLPPMHLT